MRSRGGVQKNYKKKCDLCFIKNCEYTIFFPLCDIENKNQIKSFALRMNGFNVRTQ